MGHLGRLAWLARILVRHQRERCYLCGRRMHEHDRTGDHVFPRRTSTTVWNLLVSCRACNGRKADRLPHPCELVYLDAANEVVQDRWPDLRGRRDAARLRTDLAAARASLAGTVGALRSPATGPSSRAGLTPA